MRANGCEARAGGSEARAHAGRGKGVRGRKEGREGAVARDGGRGAHYESPTKSSP